MPRPTRLRALREPDGGASRSRRTSAGSTGGSSLTVDFLHAHKPGHPPQPPAEGGRVAVNGALADLPEAQRPQRAAVGLRRPDGRADLGDADPVPTSAGSAAASASGSGSASAAAGTSPFAAVPSMSDTRLPRRA